MKHTFFSHVLIQIKIVFFAAVLTIAGCSRNNHPHFTPLTKLSADRLPPAVAERAESYRVWYNASKTPVGAEASFDPRFTSLPDSVYRLGEKYLIPLRRRGTNHAATILLYGSTQLLYGRPEMSVLFSEDLYYLEDISISRDSTVLTLDFEAGCCDFRYRSEAWFSRSGKQLNWIGMIPRSGAGLTGYDNFTSSVNWCFSDSLPAVSLTYAIQNASDPSTHHTKQLDLKIDSRGAPLYACGDALLYYDLYTACRRCSISDSPLISKDIAAPDAAIQAVTRKSSARWDTLSASALTAADFVEYLEKAGWHRSLPDSEKHQIQADLETIRGTDPNLTPVQQYDIYQMDFGRRNRYRDGVHAFTVLEIVFDESRNIPGANNRSMQLFLDSSSAWPRQGQETADASPASVFPLWLYQDLDRYGIFSGDYTVWKAIKIENKVFVISTRESKARENIASRFRLFLEYAAHVSTEIQ